jgi:hypothetical protein
LIGEWMSWMSCHGNVVNLRTRQLAERLGHIGREEPTMSTPGRLTLHEDWQRRRAALVRQGSARTPTGDLQLQMLDAMLARYGESAVGSRAARFALPSRTFARRDALLAEHGLAKECGTIRNERQAHDRMARVLERMATSHEPGAAAPRKEVFIATTKDGRRANRLRLALADTAAVRVNAIRQLAEMGDPDDFGLFLDLLSLPGQPDEIPAERATLLWGLQRISGGPSSTVNLPGKHHTP